MDHKLLYSSSQALVSKNPTLVSNLLNQRLQTQRIEINEIIKDLHELTIKIDHEDLAKTVSDLRDRINDPFMFVIVGEVKAGKSSFINALLATGNEVAKVAPHPMTDTIQQIIYGEEEEHIMVNPFLKKILLPVDILQEIAIVDTPGTNTIEENHQEITEGFIPASDLIVFVFEAKNPYRQSAWDFFDYIHSDWQKKIIFVLQQKDLMPEEDLQINIKGVKEYAEKKGINDPNVFAVSAKDEIEGKLEESGFYSVRNYISENITGGKAPILKLQNNISISQNISDRIAAGLELRHKQYEADVEFREDIRETLDNQEVKSKKQVDVLVENLLAGYDRITQKKQKELASGLSFLSLVRRSFSSIFTRQASAKEWLEDLAKELETDLNTELNQKLNSGVTDLADSIQQMVKIIDLKIRSSQTILKNDHELFSDIAERRSTILRDLQDAFSDFMNRTENFTDEELFPDKSTLSPNLAVGGAAAAFGLIFTAMTSGAVLDITGGVITAVGLLFAGVATSGKRRKLIQSFNTEIEKGRTQLDEEISFKLKLYIQTLKNRIDKNFNAFDQMLEKENTQLQALQGEHLSINERLSAISTALET